MSKPWMPLYIADYLRDTRRLTTAEHGAYLLLMMDYWSNGSLPDNDADLARIVGMTAAEWKKSKAKLQSFFHDGWKHKRIEKELAHAEEVSCKRRAIAEQRHNKRHAIADAIALPIADQLHTQSQSQSQSPEKEKKQDAAIAAPADAGETDLFRRGKAVLGSNSGGLINKVLLAKNKSIPLARALIETAATKENPREWIAAAIRGSPANEDARARGDAW